MNDTLTSGTVHRVNEISLGRAINAAYHGSTESALEESEGELENAVELLDKAIGWKIDRTIAWQLDDDLPHETAILAHKQFANALAAIREARRQLEALTRRYGG